jgi:FkbM family methyltransferase
MDLNSNSFLNKTGKTFAKPLSRLLVNPRSEKLSRLFEAYWCILLGKGAGTGWDMGSEIRAAKTVIKSAQPIILDVGANKGDWSSMIHSAFPKAHIFMFEPQPICQEIIRQKEIPNSKLFPNAVSSRKGNLELCTVGGAAGHASLHKRRDSYFQAQNFSWIDVETVTIDDVVSEHGLGTIDLMKMDIEGHELEALRGAENSLKNRTIKAFTFEFGSGNINSRTFFHDFWDYLTPFGYRIYRLLPSSRLMHIKEYYEDCEYFRGVTNYIAISTDISM